MNILSSPPPSRYDLNFDLAGIPVRVHPLFWLMALLLGASTNNLVQLLIWVVVVFISILVHELGHALAMRNYGLRSRIVLHLTGGLTIPESVRWGGGLADVALDRKQEIVISLAGPFAGFLLAGLVLAGSAAAGGTVVLSSVFGFLPLPAVLLPFGGSILNSLVMTFLWVNLFWGLINLMPVIPLDGGNVARQVMIRLDPWDGLRKSLWLSAAAGAVVALAGLVLMRSLYVALLFGLLAYQSWQALQRHAGRY